MFSWKKLSTVSMAIAAVFLLTVYEVESGENDTYKSPDQVIADGQTFTGESFTVAAVDQPIPEAKKEVEGLPEVTGIDSEKSAVELAKDTSVKLKNPFTGDPEKIEIGKKKWFSFGCSGCHGGGGGGGMCPSVINEKWVYGGKDDVLFRLITLGTDQLMEQGHTRIKKEKVVAPMPQVGEMTNMTTEDVWLVLTYMRTKFKGREEKIEW